MTKGVVALAWMLSFAALAAAQEKTKVPFKDARSCNEFAAPARQALGKRGKRGHPIIFLSSNI